MSEVNKNKLNSSKSVPVYHLLVPRDRARITATKQTRSAFQMAGDGSLYIGCMGNMGHFTSIKAFVAALIDFISACSENVEISIRQIISREVLFRH